LPVVVRSTSCSSKLVGTALKRPRCLRTGCWRCDTSPPDGRPPRSPHPRHRDFSRRLPATPPSSRSQIAWPRTVTAPRANRPPGPRQVHPTARSGLPDYAHVNVIRPPLSTRVPSLPEMDRRPMSTPYQIPPRRPCPTGRERFTSWRQRDDNSATRRGLPSLASRSEQVLYPVNRAMVPTGLCS
jgi:hypothetical protein